MFQCFGHVMRPGKLRIVSLSRRHIWAMHINWKWGLFPFNMPWQYQICITTCTCVFTVVDTICLKIWAKQCPRMQKIHFCLKCLAQKCCWLSSLMMFSWLKQSSKMWWVWLVSFLFCKVFLDCPNYFPSGIEITVFIWISTQPRISAHLEYVPILRAGKVNKRPASNKRPPPPHPTSFPLPLKLKQVPTPFPRLPPKKRNK